MPTGCFSDEMLDLQVSGPSKRRAARADARRVDAEALTFTHFFAYSRGTPMK